MAQFLDKLFPIAFGESAWVEPHFSTSVSTSDSGFETRNINWSQSRLQFDAGPGVRSLSDLRLLLEFFREAQGNAAAFRFRDPFDHKSGSVTEEPSATDIVLGRGDGGAVRFPLVKRYGQGEERRITRPVPASVVVALDGQIVTDWTLAEGGIVEFLNAPPLGKIVTAGFEFHVPVRFEQSFLRISRKSCLAGELHSVPLIEVREG